MGTYTIRFNTNGGKLRSDMTVSTGSWVQIDPPEFGENAFDGWTAQNVDRTTARFSTSLGMHGLNGGNAVTADPMPIPSGISDGKILVKDLAPDGMTAVLTARWRKKFGGYVPGCPTVEMPSFSPICTKGTITQSSPLTIDVPVPMFSPYVPPPECACFTFEAKTATVSLHTGAAASGTASVEIKVADGKDCCAGKYVVTPTIDITIPECPITDNVVIDAKSVDIGGGGSILLTAGIRNCTPYFDISAVPVTIPAYTPPDVNVCFAPLTTTMGTSYSLPGDEEPTTIESKTISIGMERVTEGPYRGCWKPVVEGGGADGAIMFDLSSLAFGNGGSVTKDESDGNLYIDGTLGNDYIWYGGGIGDYESTGAEQDVLCRSINQRGYASVFGTGTHHVPYENASFRFVIPTTGSKAYVWQSHSASEDDSEGGAGVATGNLAVMMPTGFQWAHGGVGMNVVGFRWSKNGLLYDARETQYAAVVSPGIMLFANNTSKNSVSIPKYTEASGLKIYDEDNTYTAGLSVYDGNGLRIFGVDAKTQNSEVTSTQGIGQLEVWEGNGLRVRGAAAKTSTSLSKNGQLEVYAHASDFKFNYDGKMVMNDEEPSSSDVIYAPIAQNISGTKVWIGKASTASATYTAFTRNTDVEVAAVVADPRYWSTYWKQSNSTGMVRLAASNTISTKKQAVTTGITNAEYYGEKDSSGTLLRGIRITDFENLVKDLQAQITYLATMLDSLSIVKMLYARSGVLISAGNYNDYPTEKRHYEDTAPTS